jgi:hypothetical protein
MSFLPNRTGNLEWIDAPLLPPLSFVACGVNLVVVDGAERHRELIAYLEIEASRLRVADMMGV